MYNRCVDDINFRSIFFLCNINATVEFCFYCLVSRRYHQLMIETLEGFIEKIIRKYVII
ncbi:unnamed protein product [Brugia timori]|uniref:G_PROTEIN_RECEP_F1_2 domain-containing protein n=1 Tax=Brugia timori TaxID=42155 RepID=A0A0R3QL40_9BILA|nr:unnamed protein product [Brugia timori]